MLGKIIAINESIVSVKLDINIYDSIPFEEKREIVLKTFNVKK